MLHKIYFVNTIICIGPVDNFIVQLEIPTRRLVFDYRIWMVVGKLPQGVSNGTENNTLSAV